MSTAIELVGAAVLGASIIAIGVQWAGDRLAEGLSERVEAVSQAIESISEATFAYPPRPTRTILAGAGTRLAYVVKANDELRIEYTPVLAFVESHSSVRIPLL